VDADDVARPGFLDVGAVLGHEDGGVGDLDFASQAHVADLHATGELAGADAEECNAVPVGRVHVCLDLEGKAAERFFIGRYGTAGGFSWERVRSVFDKCIQQLLHAEGVDGAAEEDRCLAAGQVGFPVKGVAGALQEFDVVA